MSNERFDQLRAEVETLGRAEEAPSQVQIRVVETAEDSCVECKSPSRAKSRLRNEALDNPPPTEYRLNPPEEKDARQDVEAPADRDVAMTTDDDAPAEATIIPVLMPHPNSKRNPRTSAKPVSQHS